MSLKMNLGKDIWPPMPALFQDRGLDLTRRWTPDQDGTNPEIVCYSPDVINTQQHNMELNIILPRVNNFDIKQKNLVWLYVNDIKQGLGR